MIKRWLKHPAKWYEFWYPQSGFVGGLLAFAILYSGLSIWF